VNVSALPRQTLWILRQHESRHKHLSEHQIGRRLRVTAVPRIRKHASYRRAALYQPAFGLTIYRPPTNFSR
jgi:hypothetical protein